MEESERSRSRSPRRASRVEQVVGRWLRRSRDSLSRERILDGKSERSGSVQQNFPVKVTVEVIRDAVLDSHGFSLSTQLPLLVREVIAGGPADGRLLPDDQVLKVNNKVIEDLPPEHVEEMIRECQDSVSMTILRHMSNPKSSIMSAEKRARLRRNPVKVSFAEEVVVNGHTQGNSLLFLPNVLKVYLENGQTKAFKFDSSTTVKDILSTLKDKLSIRSIEHFSLILEQQYSITKLLLLHEDEFIQQVVRKKKDSHDYRCLFRVCFIPRDPLELLQEDPVAFEYLFQQSVGDVLQERFAVEMKCNTALRLAALHMHERLASCGQTHRASVKSIIKEFGLESFISPTLLRNMRDKDLRKALGYHLKKIESLLEPRQKVISVSQARLAYLTQMGELISYSGRSYSATMLLQDRESLVSLLVGARYGLSQVLNHKLNMISTIIDFNYITRVEVHSESDRVSMLKIYLQDIQPIALLMESLAAKDLACLLAGYCRLMVDPNMNIYRWGSRPKVHRISAEEGYVSRCGSDSEESSEEDYSIEALLDTQLSDDTHSTHSTHSMSPSEGREPQGEEEAAKQRGGDERQAQPGKVRVIVTEAENEEEGGGAKPSNPVEGDEERLGVEALLGVEEWLGVEALLEAGWYTDPRVNSSFSSLSSNSLNTLEENSRAPSQAPAPTDAPKEGRHKPCPAKGPSSLDVHHPYLLEVPDRQEPRGGTASALRPTDLAYDPGLCYAQLSQMSDYLPSPPEASDDCLSDEEEEEEEEGDGGDGDNSTTSADLDAILSSCRTNSVNSKTVGVGVQALLARIRSHPACGQKDTQREEETPWGPSSKKNALSVASSRRGERSQGHHSAGGVRESGSESEDDEFFDAQDRLTPPFTEQEPIENDTDASDKTRALTVSDIGKAKTAAHKNRDRDTVSLHIEKIIRKSPSHVADQGPSPSRTTPDSDRAPGIPEPPAALPSLKAAKGELPPEATPVSNLGVPQRGVRHAHGQCNGDIPGRNAHLSSELLEMEPDTMEFKPVTSTAPPHSSPLIMATRQAQPRPRAAGAADGRKNEPRWEDRISDHAPVCSDKPSSNRVLLEVPGPHNVPSPMQTGAPKATGDEGVETGGLLIRDHGEGGPQRDQACPSSPRQPKRDESKLSPSSQPPKSPVSTSSSPLSHPSSVPKVIAATKEEGKKGVPPNGLHPWGQRNGTGPPSALCRGVSLSHENLRSKKTHTPTTRAISASTTPTPSPSPSVSVRSSICIDPSKDSVGTGAGLASSSRTSSSGRLSTSALRGKIQDLPWYLTRSQEILGTIALHNGGSSTDRGPDEVAKAADKGKESKKATSSPTLHDGPEEGAEVVIVKLKDGPQEVTSLVKETNGETETRTDLKEKGSQNNSELYKHLGTCKSEQPQSQRDTHTDAGLGGPSPPSPATAAHQEACGCRTVYANCFSGDAEDGCGFDDELTVYEFSRRTRINKPPQSTPAPSSLAAPSPNALSLLRDSPRPLSCSSELSPLLSPPRPLEPLPLEQDLLGDPLRFLQGQRYGTGQRGAGLKGGYSSLRRDIDELLLVLMKGAPAVSHPGHRGHCEKGSGANGTSLSETDRCLLQTEARRLASGCQRATRVGWAPDDALLSLGNSFGALVHLAAACLRISCPECGGCHGDIDGIEALGKLQEIVGLYKEFVAAVETAREGEGVRILAKQCTVLISSVFSLTQLFRTRTPDTDNSHTTLNF